MNTNISIHVLRKLLEINHNRIDVYKTAYGGTRYKDLKTFFTGCIKTSQKCNVELENEVQQLDGDILNNFSVTGKIFTFWMKINVALSNYGRKRILDYCKYGEEIVKKAYQKVLQKKNSKNITIKQIKIITKQQDLMESDHKNVSYLRDNSV
ncbi:MAG: hypothetical protein COZ75_10015 [Flavobacteriaceae bacterium CG_4_8_14_3_um_filter_34_10]|nr:PA2169 family four-helix-bundle protein [Flavobacteriia bacterium]PIQ18642.1 MAG: hypothetical protein COW66_05390 [Flavobacteriaceae bacterium CG18_big_fil_WC_8_21_14_2_50_34_36]PIV49627.1 MAG: hypothetical protein COS19_07610 [Flavobacteriaceae bacterium CG02_land_8_20_14_3_00_34_13]PIX08830.1 MAG: hypothetical protein COZ75_10015 [Flavobacteriaceae bacterium CG_4_8_14_3_um_filter_34_10]PIZ07640.1 MAG: hypothetical protein COY56_07970 [Flavobacteriaceae bacterium CG_4_10_14_0_8_um_filter_3